MPISVARRRRSSRPDPAAGLDQRRAAARWARPQLGRSTASFHCPARTSSSPVVEALVCSATAPRSASSRAGPGSSSIVGRRPAAGVRSVDRQLIEGVERLELQPGRARRALAGATSACTAFHAPRGAVVPVVERVAEQRAGRVDQPVVHRPGVDPDAGQPRLPATPCAVPPARSRYSSRMFQCSPSGGPHRLVREPVHRRDARARPARRGRPSPDRWTRRGRPRRHSPSWVTALTAGRRRRRRRRRGCAGRWCGDRSAEQSTKTALATCSGSTSRLSRVRWA